MQKLIFVGFALALVSGCAAHSESYHSKSPYTEVDQKRYRTGNGSTHVETNIRSEGDGYYDGGYGQSYGYGRGFPAGIPIEHPPMILGPRTYDTTEAQRNNERVGSGIMILHEVMPGQEYATRGDLTKVVREVKRQQKQVDKATKKTGASTKDQPSSKIEAAGK
ncbi:MAG: hypothetical protein WC787_05180 [Patescibacteria group bacterium]